MQNELMAMRKAAEQTMGGRALLALESPHCHSKQA